MRVNFDETAIVSPQPDRSVVALDDALAAFAEVAPRQAKVVELRYFGGLQEEEIVEVLQISPRTVRRDWDFARAWLARELAVTFSPRHALDLVRCVIIIPPGWGRQSWRRVGVPGDAGERIAEPP